MTIKLLPSTDSLQLNTVKIKSLHKPLLWETFKAYSLENELQICNVDHLQAMHQTPEHLPMFYLNF